MKYLSSLFLLSLTVLSACSQNNNPGKDKGGDGIKNNSLLWKISGNGLEKPSYLFGTIHMLCKEDAFLGEQLTDAINKADKVYLELDMDNLFEMLGVMSKMKMKGDTTLADLLSPEDYQRTKEYFESHSGLLPFSMLEKYKPLVSATLLMEASAACDEAVAMEQLIMEEAKKRGKSIEGMETMAYQMSIFDSIPYKIQAQELLKSISEEGKQSDGEKEFKEMMKAYKDQNLEKLSEMMNSSDDGIMQYQDLLLNNRNRNWVVKLKTLLPKYSLVIAVGAGHLPGEKGVINLLKKEGYIVEPVENKMKRAFKEI